MYLQVVVACEALEGSVVDEEFGAELLATPCCTDRGGELLPRRLVRWVQASTLLMKRKHSSICLVPSTGHVCPPSAASQRLRWQPAAAACCCP